MREQIQQLIAEGRTEDALAYLATHTSDAVLLQARYNQAKKQQNMGIIDFGEWSRVQAQVNYAALEMAGNVKVSASNNFVISNSSVQINQSMNITINFNSAATFAESLNQLKLTDLMEIVTKEFKNKEAMKVWLPIKQEYDSFELLGTAFPPGYLTIVKEKLVTIYDEYWTKVTVAKNNQLKTTVQAIYDSLNEELTEEVIRNAATKFKLFFYQNENSGFSGHGVVDAVLHDLNTGEKLAFLRKESPEMFNDELKQMHSELITISNRILTKLEA